MSRQARQITARRDFWIFADEFHNYITPSMAEILSGARKYRIGLTLAHHELHQLQRSPEVASAVMSHPFTRIVFRVGDEDARKLGEGFSFFEPRDLKNLETGQAIARVERSDFDFNLSIPLSEEPDATDAFQRRQEVITASREKYATKKSDISAALRQVSVAPAAVGAIAEKPNPQPTAPEQPLLLPKPEPSISHATSVSEIPKSTGSEKEDAAVVALAQISLSEVPEPASREPAPPRDLGRGGAQHKAIQERIQAEAHALGFFAAVESKLLKDSQQAADVVLRTGKLAIAVEICVTTTTDHEFKNVRKCLDAGFNRVAVISPSIERLEAIKQAVNAGLEVTQRDCVSFHTPDEFIVELKKLATKVSESTPITPSERVTRGYKIRRHTPSLSPEERRARESAAIRVIAETMKPKP